MRRAVLSLAFVLFAAPALALYNGPYLTAADIDLLKIVPPPPATGSPVQASDMAEVMAAQKSRTQADIDRVIADSEVSVFRFADVLGPQFTRQSLPKTAAFFTKVTIDANEIGKAAKEAWARHRPFELDAAVQPPGELKKTVLGTDGKITYSYPSGHAAFSTMAAILLSDMVPEKRAALFERATQFGRMRVVSGLHYPSDVEAGRQYGIAVAAVLMQKPVFRADLAEAKAELRAALKLAP